MDPARGRGPARDHGHRAPASLHPHRAGAGPGGGRHPRGKGPLRPPGGCHGGGRGPGPGRDMADGGGHPPGHALRRVFGANRAVRGRAGVGPAATQEGNNIYGTKDRDRAPGTGGERLRLL